jgi:hypothetical protein
MIKLFIKKNRKAVITGYKWMSVIFTSLVLIVFFIMYLKNVKPDIVLFFTVVLFTVFIIPFIITVFAFLRWWWDYSVTSKCFNSIPFNKLDSIGFKKKTLNEGSKSKFICEYYTAMINDFIVDCDVDTQNDHKNLRFKFYLQGRQIEKEDFKRIKNSIEEQNGFFDFYSVFKKYHYKKHKLTSINQLETELIEFSKLLINLNLKPDIIARR